MRFVDIYTDGGASNSADSMALIAADCKQVGTPVMKRTPNAKRYTMASGDPLAYPSELDAATCTVELECGYAQADAISRTVRNTRLCIAGAHFGVDTKQALPLLHGTPVLVTSGADICEKFSGTGIYSVKLPVQIELDAETGAPASHTVPAVGLSMTDNEPMITINGTDEQLRKTFRYHRNGYWIRKQPVIAASSFTLGFVPTCYSGAPYFWVLRGAASIMQEPVSQNNTWIFDQNVVVQGTHGSSVSLSVSLATQTAPLEVYVIRQTYAKREIRIVIPVYKGV
ncbi:MAG: hypothetical protein K5695_03835 [Oscillospiraceae bacterium]|nr:hypothetical protein [Oscillospiraceae bacterium]